MLAPLAAILWQVTAAPAQSTGSIDVVNQVRNVDINVPDDVRSGQIFATGDDPVWGQLAWTNFAGGVSLYHTVTYRWDPGQEAMIREVSIEGTGDSQVVVTRHLDEFQDGSMSFHDALPSFLLESNVNPEVETPLGSETRDITSASFFAVARNVSRGRTWRGVIPEHFSEKVVEIPGLAAHRGPSLGCRSPVRGGADVDQRDPSLLRVEEDVLRAHVQGEVAHLV